MLAAVPRLNEPRLALDLARGERERLSSPTSAPSTSAEQISLRILIVAECCGRSPGILLPGPDLGHVDRDLEDHGEGRSPS